MKTSRGFTLIEILVAVMIAAILAVMSFGAMREALQHRETIRTRGARLTEVQAAMRSLVQDFSQLQPRPVREPLGEGYRATLMGTTAASPEVTFTRGGWANPVGAPRSTLQRVRYALREGVLYRDYWAVLDAQLQPEPATRRLLAGVKDFQVRYLDDSRNWQDSWPPALNTTNTTSQAAAAAISERQTRLRPIAIEVTLVLQDWGTIKRLIEVAG